MATPKNEREPQRIAKLLARAGVASRRDIERMIEERRIAINGAVVEKPATLLTSLHGVTVDGVPIKEPAPARLFRYHKPTGVLTAARDPAGRTTIYDRLPEGLPRLMPVGRLDMNTEGLLLLTTDGELKRQLELPSTGVERTYRARVFGDISQEQLEELIHGVEIEGIRYGAIDANLERRTGRNGWVEMKLTEGKNREVRRVLEYLGLQVSRLIRTAYGPFELEDLPVGAVDEIRQHDLVAFKSMLKGKAPAAIRSDPDRPRPPRPPRPPRSSRPDAEGGARPSRKGPPAGRSAPRGERAAPDEARTTSRGPAKTGRPFVRAEKRVAEAGPEARGPRGRGAPRADRGASFGERASQDDRASYVDRRSARPERTRDRASPKAERPASREARPDSPRGPKPGGAPKGGRPGPKGPAPRGTRPSGRGAPKR